MDLTKYPMDKQTCTLQLESWGYNINDVMFYWTRGNESVSGLDTLQLAQYTVEDHYTSVSEAVYETGVTTVLTMTTLMMGARTSLPNANCFIKAIDVYLGICFSFIFGALIEYAVAHFCSLSHADAHMFMVRLLHINITVVVMTVAMVTVSVFIVMVAVFVIPVILILYSHQMQEMEDEINGIVTTITSHSHRAKRRKEPAGTTPPAPASTQLTVSPSSPSGSEPKPEASPPEPTNLCLTTLATFRKIFRLISCCHVENPHHIDNYSRVAFPLSFVGVNLLYWTYYLYL
nr:glycine receptor subunit alpha-3 isoform X3 [Nothobranchius furzeri]